MKSLRRFLAVLAAPVLLAVAPDGAAACACCTDEGQRFVEAVAIDSFASTVLAALRFGQTAHLYTGAADVADVLPVASPDFRLEVRKDEAAWKFAFSQSGAEGTLTFALPNTLTRFEVDPREAGPSSGLGPTLYKEWRLTAPLKGTGLFAPLSGSAEATLILHGTGNSCTDASHFSAWTLVLHGRKGTTSLFGTLSAE